MKKELHFRAIFASMGLLLLTAVLLFLWIGGIESKAEIVARGFCGDYQRVKWYLEDDGALHIFGSQQMFDFEDGTAPWNQYASQITKISVASTGDNTGVTHIGSYSFAGCENLTSVEFTDPVKSIGKGAFSGCSKLTDISFGDSLETIGEAAFSGCSDLTTVTLGDTVTTIGKGAFSGCDKLKTVTLSEATKNIDETAFDGCDSLAYNKYDNCLYLGTANSPYYMLIGPESADIQSCRIHDDTRVIQQRAFRKCESLESVTIGNNVEAISERAFGSCSSLTNVSFSSSVTAIGQYAFFGCSALERIAIPETLETIGGSAFEDCENLKELIFENADGGGYKKIGSRAFSNCKSLTSVTLPRYTRDVGSNAFSGCSALVEINIFYTYETYFADHTGHNIAGGVLYDSWDPEWNAGCNATVNISRYRYESDESEDSILTSPIFWVVVSVVVLGAAGAVVFVILKKRSKSSPVGEMKF